MSRATRSLAVLLPAVALALTPVSAVSASEGPDVISLQTGSSPEGITTGPGDTFFAGARADGAVRQYSTTSGELLRTVVAPRAGEVAVGLLYDAARQQLFVAGGATGDLTVYDARTGAVVYAANAGEGRFINDVAVTPEAAYFTDSRSNEVLVVELAEGGSFVKDGKFKTIKLKGDYVQPATGNGLNGIRVLPTGDLLVVSPGGLYAVDTRTGRADRLEVTGAPALTGGDGLVLDGTTLYVVYGANPNNSVLELELAPDLGSATVVREITDTDFDRPTTGALVGGDLYVVNGQFSKPATDPTEVVRIDLP